MNRNFIIAAILFASATALGGDSNFSSRIILQTDNSAPTCSTATGNGSLCVESYVELQSTLDVAGVTTLADDLSCGDNDITNVGDINVDSVTPDSTSWTGDDIASLTSAASDPADAGVLRLGSTETICWEASPTGTDECISVDASEHFTFTDALDISGPTLTSGGTNDYVVDVSATLNDTGAAGGTDVFTAIQVDVTETDTTGWDNVYLMNLKTDTVSQFSVTDGGVVATTGAVTVGGALSCSDNNITNVGDIDVDTITPDGASWTGDDIASLTSAAADPADAGVLRLGNTETICWEADVTGTDECMSVDANEHFTFTDALDVSGPTLTSGGTNDYVLDLSATLNDTGAAGGTDVFTAIQVDVTETDTTGWDNVYLANLKVDSTSVVSVTDTGIVDITGPTLTSGGTNDFVLDLSATLNDSGAAGGTDVFRAIKVDVTETDTTGWDNVYLADLQVGSTTKWNVTSAGAVTSAGGLTVGGDVDVSANDLYAFLQDFEDKTGDDTLTTDDCGTTVATDDDGRVLTLPDTAAANKGCRITVVVTAADDVAKVSLSPHSSDGIYGMCCGVNDAATTACVALSGTADKDLECQKAEQNKGDSVTLVSDGATGWFVVGCVGAGWASES